jgi:predicted O-methyltransferase YrrM
MLQKDTELSQENYNEMDDYHHQATTLCKKRMEKLSKEKSIKIAPNNRSDETYKRILRAISISEAPLAMKRILCLKEIVLQQMQGGGGPINQSI